MYDGIMVVLDKEYSKKDAEVIRDKILKIEGVDKATLAIMNIEKEIAFAEKELKETKRVWIRLNENFAGILEKNGTCLKTGP